jgi:hypothetical protein
MTVVSFKPEMQLHTAKTVSLNSCSTIPRVLWNGTDYDIFTVVNVAIQGGF